MQRYVVGLLNMDPVRFWEYSLAEIDMMIDGDLMRKNPKAYRRLHRESRPVAEMRDEIREMEARFGLSEERKGGADK